MKNIVIMDDYDVRDLKPPALISEYLRLTERDVADMLVPVATVDVPCPACRSTEVVSEFVKFGMTYRECGNCHSLYVSPRPDDVALANYDAHSEARRYWRETLAPGSVSARQEKIIKPRSEWVTDSTREYSPSASTYADIGTVQASYIAEILAEDLFTAVERDAGADPADVVSLFEVADRTSDVDALFARVAGMLPPTGLAFVTAILSSGFDLLTLWERADNVFPPDRLNVLSADGIRILFARRGFEVLEFSTPGILDVEIVSAALKRDPSLAVSRWARYIAGRDERSRRAFQQFLQSELLSSYGRFVLRKS